jgi:hypothetical protein
VNLKLLAVGLGVLLPGLLATAIIANLLYYFVLYLFKGYIEYKKALFS